MQRVVWLGYLLDFSAGRIHVESKKITELLALLKEVGAERGKKVGVRRLAKITGKLMAMGLALQPVRLMSRGLGYDLQWRAPPGSVDQNRARRRRQDGIATHGSGDTRL